MRRRVHARIAPPGCVPCLLERRPIHRRLLTGRERKANGDPRGLHCPSVERRIVLSFGGLRLQRGKRNQIAADGARRGGEGEAPQLTHEGQGWQFERSG